MIGGIIARVVQIGPQGIRPGEAEPSFPNTIKLVVEDWGKSAEARARKSTPDRCAVHVEPGNYNIEAGDKCWWQAGTIYWTKPNSRLSDIRLRKVGFSYSGESLDLPLP